MSIMDEYWCHICKRTTELLSQEEIVCTTCSSPFVECIEPESHPSNFIPYQPTPSFSQLLTELLLSSNIRSVRYNEIVEENLDDIIHQLMQNDPNSYGPPPASQEAIDCLKTTEVTDSLLQERSQLSKAVDECGARLGDDRMVLDCCVCREEFTVGERVLDMPCAHLFHTDCLLPWLQKHNNCPTCRFELATEA